MADADPLLITRDGPVLHIGFNRPDRLNALTPEMHEGVIAALRNAEGDREVRCVAFSGEGRAFCAGEDIGGGPRSLPERLRPRAVALDIGMGPVLLHEVTTAIRATPLPTVALLHGHALGGGYDYATSCDFRVATQDCRFGDPRVHRALWAAEGWSYKLTRLIPQGHATRIALLGEPLTGTEAYDIGLVHRLYPAGSDVRAEAQKLLTDLAGIDPETYAVTKRAIVDGLDLRYDAALAHRARGL